VPNDHQLATVCTQLVEPSFEMFVGVHERTDSPTMRQNQLRSSLLTQVTVVDPRTWLDGHEATGYNDPNSGFIWHNPPLELLKM
jgi:hypothetical protein